MNTNKIKEECKHSFEYSHHETEFIYGSTTTYVPERVDVVVCLKCGEVRRYKIESLEEKRLKHDRGDNL